HIAEQTYGERYGSKNVRRELDQYEQWRQENHWPQELFYIMDPVCAHTPIVVSDEHHQPESQIAGKEASWERESRHEAQKVGNQDKNKYAAKKSDRFHLMYNNNNNAKTHHQLHRHLHDISRPQSILWHRRIDSFQNSAAKTQGQRQHNQNDNQSHKSGLGEEIQLMRERQQERVPSKRMFHLFTHRR